MYNQQLLQCIQEFGRGSLSFSSLQEGMSGFYRERDHGFIAHSPTDDQAKRTICLADPICPNEFRPSLLHEFTNTYKDPVFVHITRETADVLAQMGFFVNEMGLETVLDVQQFSLKGSKKEFLRSQRNRAIRDGLQVIEPKAGEISADTMHQISEAWIKHKAVSDHELAFIVRPAVYGDEPGVRRFFAMNNGQVIGFVFFDPMYENGEVVGYLANIVRTCASVSYSVADCIILEAINQFKIEGIKHLSLGFSPFADVADTGEYNYSKPLQYLFKFAFENCNYMYAFKQISFHKKRYRPGIDGTVEHKVYCATRSAMPLTSLYMTFQKMGIDPVIQTKRHLAGQLMQRLAQITSRSRSTGAEPHEASAPLPPLVSSAGMAMSLSPQPES